MSGRIIKLLIVLALFALIAIVSMQKIDAMVLSDFDVVNHNSLYEKNGFPVYTAAIESPESAFFLTDIAFVKDNSANKRMYTAYVDDDKRKVLRIGYVVIVPKVHETLREGYDRNNIENYYRGKISSIASSKDWQTGLYRVNILMDTELPPEPFYSAKTVSAILKNIVLAPITNLESTDGKLYAWTLEDDNTAKRTELVTGICDGYNCEIKAGLQAGDLLITSDLKKLKEGLLLNNVGKGK